jgi:hypothetical protein
VKAGHHASKEPATVVAASRSTSRSDKGVRREGPTDQSSQTSRSDSVASFPTRVPRNSEASRNMRSASAAWITRPHIGVRVVTQHGPEKNTRAVGISARFEPGLAAQSGLFPRITQVA